MTDTERILVKNKILWLNHSEVASDVTYQNCELVMTKFGAPRFINCTFIRCTFRPTFHRSEQWPSLMQNCRII